MFRWLLAVCLILGAVHHVDAGTAAPLAPSEADRQFIELYEREWQWRLRQYPQLATAVGVHDHDDRLGNFDLRSQRQRLRQLGKFRKRLEQLEVAELSSQQRINYAVYAAQLDNAIAALELDAHLMPMTSDSSFYADLAMLPDVHPRSNESDYLNYLARLRAIPRFLEQHTELLKEGLARGITLPAVILRGREAPIRAIAESADIESLAFYTPFQSMPATISEKRANELRAEARALIRDQVIPAYARLLRYFVSTYQPGARKTIAAYDLPDGKAYYRQQIREYTTLDLEPEAIHQIGLEEVARIRGEMEQVIHDAGFDGDFAAFLEFLRKDSQFYARTPRELLMHASYWAKRIDGLLPKYFSRLPRQPYGVAPVPAAIAPYYTTGRYNPAPEGGKGAGFYWVNTWKLEARPLYALAALTLHEAVPGHHLQTALASEQEAQPAFRRYSYISAYGEGWALYAEHLGVEMGVYETPYDQFGRLTYEMWRAARLVVDTGMHAKGWTREQALTLLRDNTALSEHEIATEVDRYISWPGQALSYKLGELKIRALRQSAETRLGNRFDLRRFHDAVLALGSVPLPVLEAQIERHIESELAIADTR